MKRFLAAGCFFILSITTCGGALAEEISAVPELQVEGVFPGDSSPWMAGTAITWKAEVTGGAGELVYRFDLRQGESLEESRQSGPSATWTWEPEEPGTYQVRVVVSDALGNSDSSVWSAPFRVVPILQVERPRPDEPSPRVVGTTVRWSTEATGGIGEATFSFRLRRNGDEELLVSRAREPVRDWQPAEPGTYQVQARATDAHGNIATSPWSEPFAIRPPVEIKEFSPGKSSPRITGTEVAWTADAEGGVGEKTFEFRLREGGKEQVLQTGPSPRLSWVPRQPGSYRLRVVCRDTQGNTARSEWRDFRIVSPPTVSSVASAPGSPRVADMTTVVWQAEARGGVGDLTYEFRLRRGESLETPRQTGPSSRWEWTPREPGDYFLRVIVEDANGNIGKSEWHGPYRIAPELRVTSLEAGKTAPQVAGTPVSWQAEASGGVGKRSYALQVRKPEGDPVTVETGPEPFFAWTPGEAGRYQVRIQVRDALENQAASPWSEPFPIAPALTITAPAPSLSAPRSAGSAIIDWQSGIRGGVGDYAVEFLLRRGDESPVTRQQGPAPIWQWAPREPGTYYVKVLAADSLGNTVESDWSAPYEIVPPLRIDALVPDQPAPQAAETTTIRWSADAAGGIGEYRFEFFIRRNGEPATAVQAGPQAVFPWAPDEAGHYRLRVVVQDERDNRVESDWSEPFEIAPPLVLESLQPGQAGPRAAGSSIEWRARASGGVGEYTFAFQLSSGPGESLQMKTGPSPSWTWTPAKAGVYRVRAIVTDRLGNTVESDWSPPYRILPELQILSVVPDPAPPRTVTTPVSWEVESRGGAGEIIYEFRLRKGEALEEVRQAGPSQRWQWTPGEPGTYFLRVLATDAQGNTAKSAWSKPYRIVPPLQFEDLFADRPAPQAAVSTTILWTAQASGGVGEHEYRFFVKKQDQEQLAQAGPAADFAWTPETSGSYRLRVEVRDIQGNKVASAWSEPYRILPQLQIVALQPDRKPPQVADTLPIAWQAEATGGVGDYTFEFFLQKGEEPPVAVSQGPEAFWSWKPKEPGVYRVRVMVRDSRDNVVRSGWSEPYRIARPLEILSLGPDRPAPQAAVTTTITWEAEARGGVGELAYTFRLRREDGYEDKALQDRPAWKWTPPAKGIYRAKVLVTDALGNTAESGWSGGYEIVPRLQVRSPEPDLPAPRPSIKTEIRWQAEASGGVGERTFVFRLREADGDPVATEPQPESDWTWKPEAPGKYQVQVVATDALGNTAKSEWSAYYQVGVKSIAVLPFVNLTALPVPADELKTAFVQELEDRGIEVLEERVLQKFMKRHRIRYSGGVSPDLRQKFKDETGVDGLLLTFLESYADGAPPRVALTSRLVWTEGEPAILWTDGSGMTGADSPGFLSLGLVQDIEDLAEKAQSRIASSLKKFLAGDGGPEMTDAKRKFAPKVRYRGAELLDKRPLKIAVVPFQNQTEKKYASEILHEHWVEVLFNHPDFQVLDPGALRAALFRYRLVMPEGLSLANSGLLFSVLDVDLILTGSVLKFEDAQGSGLAPNLGFSAEVIQRGEQKIVWSSSSANEGDEGVFFYNMGKITTAHDLANRMIACILEEISDQ